MAALHLRAQAFERAQLQLLDGPLTFAKPLGGFPDAPLVHEPLVNDAPLRFRKLTHEPKQPRTVFDGAYIEMHARIGRVLRHTRGHQGQACELLGIYRKTLRNKLRDLGIAVDRVVTERAEPSDE